MSESSSLWLYETTVSGKGTQISDLEKTESKSLVSTNLNSRSDEGKETQKSDLGKSEIISLASTDHNFWSDEGKETQKTDLGISCSLVSNQSMGKAVLRESCSKLFRTEIELNWRGESYNFCIDCDSSEWKMLIMVENRVAVNVEHLVWNFRGIKIFDGGSVTDPVKFEVVWNVKDWLFDKPMMGEAIFIFRKLNPTSSSLATIADFSDSTDIFGYPLLVYAWNQEDQIE
ncbi:hypothetical protein SUGI_0288730 [Cryptomeria japonica]|nr:hypothetical protein SUGI_0288730 [Cryptomeria japonica]